MFSSVRRIPSLVALLLVAAVCLSVPAGAAAALPAKAPATFFGTNVDGPVFDDPAVDAATEFGRMRTIGIRRVRAVLDWAYAEPERQGVFDWTRADALIGRAAARGIGVLPVVLRAPAWAVAPATSEYGTPPQDPATYAAFLTVLVKRYGPSGDFWRLHHELPAFPIRSWQIWNEPNIPQFWTGRPMAPTYVRLLKPAYAALHRADPGAQVYLAGLSSTGIVDGVQSACWESLAALYAAGAGGNFDVLAIHPYTGTPKRVVQILRRTRKVAAAHGDGSIPLALTETSWSSGGGGRPGATWDGTEASQAAFLAVAFDELVRRRETLNLIGVYWYTWLSPQAGAASDWSGFAGLNRMVGSVVTPKPVLEALQRTIRRLAVR
jgi:hypothetical protein